MISDRNPKDERRHREVEFFIINKNTGAGKGDYKGPKNTGTLIELDSTGMGMLTHVPLQPGDIVELDQGGASATGIVMWSIESSDKFRIQMRFV
jgi:hypothetical protein